MPPLAHPLGHATLQRFYVCHHLFALRLGERCLLEQSLA